MRKGRTVIGQDVYSLQDGQRVHSVKDLLVNEEHDAIVALLVDEGGLLGTSTIVPIESVSRFGPDAVMVDDARAVVPASSDARVAAVLDRKVSLLGTPVITTEGSKVGSIGDMYFDEVSGSILGYEVSGGTMGDVMRGTSWLPRSAVQVVGPDAVIAIPEAGEIVESQVGGVQGALDAARERAAAAGDAVSALATPSEGDGEQAPPDPVANDPDGQLVGRRATADVTDQTGSIVVANGQRVTLDHVQRARAEGGLDALYAAVGVERPKPIGEQVAAATQTVAETAGDLWSRFTAKLSDVTDSAGRKVDTQQTKSQLDRIHDAIGRPVTKVFLDREDTVILDLGDLVTHQAIQRAYEAGMLDSMLASVYRPPEITFTREEMKAPVAGDSTIEQATGGATLVDELEERIAENEAPPEPEAEPVQSSQAGAPAPKRAAGRTTTSGSRPDPGAELTTTDDAVTAREAAGQPD